MVLTFHVYCLLLLTFLTIKKNLKCKNPNKTIKYALNQILPQLWPIVNFNVDAKYDFKIFNKQKILQKDPLNPKIQINQLDMIQINFCQSRKPILIFDVDFNCDFKIFKK